MINIRKVIGTSNSYIINFRNSENEYFTVIIDPSVSYFITDKYIKGKLAGIILTHGHYDHFSEINSYIDNIGYDVPIFLHKNAIEKLFDPMKSCAKLFGINYKFNYDKSLLNEIKDNKITFKYSNNEEEVLKIIYTPGHTNCSISIMYKDKIFTGDFVFNMAIGRTDLYSGDIIAMNKSINWIKNLIKFDSTNDYFLYPGHENEASLREEIKINYYLK